MANIVNINLDHVPDSQVPDVVAGALKAAFEFAADGKPLGGRPFKLVDQSYTVCADGKLIPSAPRESVVQFSTSKHT